MKLLVRTAGRAPLVLFAPFVVLAAASCARHAPSTPEDVCEEACNARSKHCSEAECHRGCAFLLDRLLEHEGEHVLACVAKDVKRACNDRLFADCAVRVGEHADGGPPPPKDIEPSLDD